MNISCVICSDILTAVADVYVTKCGHMFHYVCIIEWLQRNPSCPQCRSKVTEKNVQRIYFNVIDTPIEDAGILLNKLENLQFQMTLKEKDVKIYKDKLKKIKEINSVLREEVATLEKSQMSHESVIHALKDQIAYFKTKSKETDRLSEEIIKLKTLLKDMEHVQLAIEGNREQVNEMIRKENNPDSLAILAATLKKALLDVEKKKRDLEVNLKRTQNEATKLKRDCTDLTSQNLELKRELQHLKMSFKEEKTYLKKKIQDLYVNQLSTDDSAVNSSVQCIISESPVNYNKTLKPKFDNIGKTPEKRTEETNIIDLDSTTESVIHISDTSSGEQKRTVNQEAIIDVNSAANSPYLHLKSNALRMSCSSLLKSKFQTNLTSPKKGYSIFKSASARTDNLKPKKNVEVTYNGLGGSSKEDTFPTSQPISRNLKRQKSSTILSSNKIKKLAPIISDTKITNFISSSSQ